MSSPDGACLVRCDPSMAARSRTDTLLGYIGANVRRLRAARGWTHKELAAKSGIMWRSIQVLESGKGNPTVKLLIAVANALGVKPTDLYAVAKPERTRPGRPPAT